MGIIRTQGCTRIEAHEVNERETMNLLTVPVIWGGGTS